MPTLNQNQTKELACFIAPTNTHKDIGTLHNSHFFNFLVRVKSRLLYINITAQLAILVVFSTGLLNFEIYCDETSPLNFILGIGGLTLSFCLTLIRLALGWFKPWTDLKWWIKSPIILALFYLIGDFFSRAWVRVRSSLAYTGRKDGHLSNVVDSGFHWTLRSKCDSIQAEALLNSFISSLGRSKEVADIVLRFKFVYSEYLVLGRFEEVEKRILADAFIAQKRIDYANSLPKPTLNWYDYSTSLRWTFWSSSSAFVQAHPIPVIFTVFLGGGVLYLTTRDKSVFSLGLKALKDLLDANRQYIDDRAGDLNDLEDLVNEQKDYNQNELDDHVEIIDTHTRQIKRLSKITFKTLRLISGILSENGVRLPPNAAQEISSICIVRTKLRASVRNTSF